MWIYIMNIFIILNMAKSHILDPGIIADYFKMKSVNRLTILSCLKIGEAALLWKNLQKEGFILSFNYDSLDYLNQRREGVVMDLSCSNAENLITKISSKRMFNLGREWLIFGKNLEIQNSLDMLKDAYILPGSSVVLVHTLDFTVKYYDIYKINPDHPLKVKIIGEGLPKDIKNLKKWEDRSNFEKATLRAASVIMHPEVYKGFDNLDYPEIDTWPKMHYPLAVNLEQQLNFIMDLEILNDYGWLKNGSFSGLMGKLQRDEIDFAATGFFIRHDRMTASDFTGDTYSLKSLIIFKQPALSTVSNIFLLPFSKLVWISCGLLSLLVAVLLAFEIVVLKKFKSKSFTSSVTFYDILTLVLGFICQQGTNLNPVSISSRIIIFIFSLSALFFYTSYSANIVALLQSTSPVLKNITDLTNSHLAMKVQDLEYNRIFMRSSTDPNVKDLFKKKIEPFGKKAYCTPREGVHLLRTGSVAFQVEINLGYKIISETFGENEKCGLGEIRMLFIPSLSIPVVKKSGYRETFKQKLIWQRESGIMDRIAKIWIPQRPNCEGKGKGFLRVGMVDFLPAILSLIYGTGISFAIFLLEIIYSHRTTCLDPYKRRIPRKF